MRETRNSVLIQSTQHDHDIIALNRMKHNV